MSETPSPDLHAAASDTLSIIMGGGAGTRLFPLTKDRSKPAVPLGGKYRLVDIPISNCLLSNLRKIYILTQFNSVSLHRHIHNTYRFDPFMPGFVEILAAQQTPGGANWYQGTADAVRQNLRYFLMQPYKYFLILSGDQLYSLNFKDVLDQHIRKNSDITIATIPVNRENAKGFGIMHTDAERCIYKFVEKPKKDDVLDSLRIPPGLLSEIGKHEGEDLYQASMGIYIFNREVLKECLNTAKPDFGKDIIPDAIKNYKVNAYIFQGYWEDIGSIRSFYQANLALVSPNPPFSFFEKNHPIFTHSRFLPASKINRAHIDRAILSDGCMLTDVRIENSLVGIRSIIQNGTTVKDSVLMGADFYPGEDSRTADEDFGDLSIPVGIGQNCHIERAIIDKNARIGDNVRISPEGKPATMDADLFHIRDGIMVVAKNTLIPSGTVI